MLNGIKDALDQAEYQTLKEILPSIISKMDQLQVGSQTPLLQLRNQQVHKLKLQKLLFWLVNQRHWRISLLLFVF